MLSKLDTAGGLTNGGGKYGTSRIADDHPQRAAYLATIQRPAVSLEAWFDAGLKQAIDDRGQAGITGARMLPHGYDGCEGGRLLINTSRVNVQVWPVRLDLGEWEVDTQKPWTLYHYTNRDCFDKCVHMFGHPEEMKQQGHKQAPFAKLLYDEFQADFNERCPKPSDMNPRGELELLAIEPVKFSAREDVLLTLFGGKVPSGITADGRSFDTFAECCLAVQVPGSACFPLVSSDAAGSGLTVRIDRETLDALYLRGEARRQLVKKRAEEEARNAGLETVKKKSGGLLGCIFGTSGGDAEDLDAIKEKQRRERRKHDGKDRVQREKKISEVRVQQLSDRWAKEHFVNVKADRDRLEARRRELEQANAERDAAQMARTRAKEEAERLADHTRHTGKVRTAEQVNKILKPDLGNIGGQTSSESKPSMTEKIRKAMGNEVIERDALALYKEHKVREQGEKEFAMAPLARIKHKKSPFVHGAKAAHPQDHGTLEDARDGDAGPTKAGMYTQ